MGEERVTNALALEAMSMTGGNMLGTLLGGTVINFAGSGQVFLLIGVCYAASFTLLLGVPAPGQARPAAASARAILGDVAAGFRFVRGHAGLVSLLGVTVVMNLFYYTYTPLVPVFADRLRVDAFWTGVLASASGFGAILGALLLAARPTRRRGLVYAGGAAGSMVSLGLFAIAAWYPAAVAALFLSGALMSGFSTMQSVLVMSTAGSEMRGRAMGLLSMAIGTLPFGMIVLGLVAQQTGAPLAVLVSVAIGLGLLLLWRLRRPEVWQIA